MYWQYPGGVSPCRTSWTACLRITIKKAFYIRGCRRDRLALNDPDCSDAGDWWLIKVPGCDWRRRFCAERWQLRYQTETVRWTLLLEYNAIKKLDDSWDDNSPARKPAQANFACQLSVLAKYKLNPSSVFSDAGFTETPALTTLAISLSHASELHFSYHFMSLLYLRCRLNVQVNCYYNSKTDTSFTGWYEEINLPKIIPVNFWGVHSELRRSSTTIPA